MSYRDSHQESGKGAGYHDSFESEKYRKMVWGLEKKYLNKILIENYKKNKISHLDFACGTGRILNFLERMTTSSTGIDISHEMIQVARNNTSSKIIEGDLTREKLLVDKKFNLVTAFRFFPNAERRLRTDALSSIYNHLENDGLLVFNNHRNKNSLIATIRRLVFREKYRGLNREEIELMLSEHNLMLIDFYSMGLFPDSYNRRMLPIKFLYYIELFLGRFRAFNGYGYNQIYVCKKNKPD
jgi:SAM-dependent methyltransferase